MGLHGQAWNLSQNAKTVRSITVGQSKIVRTTIIGVRKRTDLKTFAQRSQSTKGINADVVAPATTKLTQVHSEIPRRSRQAKKIVKRTKASCAAAVALLVTVLFTLLGCGGAGSGTAPVGFNETSISILGGQVSVESRLQDVLLRVHSDGTEWPTSILLRRYSSQLVHSPVNRNLSFSVQVFVDPSRLSNEGLDFEIPVNAQFEGNFLVASTGVGGGDQFISQEPIYTSGLLRINLPADTIGSLGELSSDGVRRIITLSFAEEIPAYETSRAPGLGQLLFYRPELPPLFPFESVPKSHSFAGKRVAVILHGLHNRSADVVDTYETIVRSLYAVNDPRAYDEIVFYEYWDQVGGIDGNARLLNSLLKDRGIDLATMVDFHGHSMGGLVTRWAIEKEGLHSASSRVFTYGTPHRGVPLPILTRLRWYYPLPAGYKSLATNSNIIQSLNDPAASVKRQIDYCTVAGTSSEYAVFGISFGRQCEQWYRDLANSEGVNERFYLPIDGIVSSWSAEPDNLASVGNYSSSTRFRVDKNHTDVAVGNDVLILVRRAIVASGSGVIR